MIQIGRFIRHPLVLMVIGFLVFMLLYALTGVAATGVRALRNTPVQVLVTLAMAGLGVAVYRWFQRRVERREDAEFAGAGAWREGALGLAGGFVLFSGVVGVVALFGGIEIAGVRGVGRLWSMMAMAVASGFYEELLFRGIAFRHLERVVGSWGALAATSAFFGLAHLVNPGATWFAALAIAFEAGIMLGAAYMLTRRLWLAIGIHAGWNFTQGWVFSVPVSGGKAADGLLVTVRHGPEWLTGGAFGLEASAVAMVLATLAGLVLLMAAVRRCGGAAGGAGCADVAQVGVLVRPLASAE